VNKRQFIVAGGAALLTPATAMATSHVQHYRTGLVRELLATGNTVLVDYYAVWCGTCRAQERKIEKLRSENSLYDEKIVFVKVDWDEFSSAGISVRHKILRRSTLLLLRGDQELGRVVAGTGYDAIKSLMDLALVAV